MAQPPTAAAVAEVVRRPQPAAPLVTVRPWRTGDERLVAAAEPQVSAASMYSRFFTGGHLFPPRYLDRLGANITIVALVGGAVVGWAEIARHPDPPYAGDLAVLIVDAWQRRRIGPVLVGAALDAARRHGISIVHADVMETNRAARRALERTFGDQITVTGDGGVLHYVLPLVPALTARDDESRTS